MPIKVLLLFGPTGVGKTELLEKLFSGMAEVVSADALQVYKRMNIGTAKPAAATLENIPHHLVDILDIREEWNVGSFCRKAEVLVHEIHTRGLLPILSGGTAYYMKSWLLDCPKYLRRIGLYGNEYIPAGPDRTTRYFGRHCWA